MLTQLSTIKTRLALTVTDYDDLLTNAIKAVSACYPIESVTKFDQIQRNRRLVRANGRRKSDPPAMRHLSHEHAELELCAPPAMADRLGAS